ncbi:MAG: DNA repair protein RadA [Candidatus Marinimicrobia bacterium]|nr:DNA repair protein RadA [Candidatus Neomarinimicrobiota bacterium]
MAKKDKILFYCSECGNSQSKWSGKCISCGAWNSLVEEQVSKKTAKNPARLNDKNPTPLNQTITHKNVRFKTGIEEFDRVTGGGFVKGSITLIGGEPGIGKSTIMIQILQYLEGEKFLYFSGEESEEQIQMRAHRLNIQDGRILLSCDNNLESILHQIEKNKPDIVVVDSIQTLYSDDFDNVPGSITQVKECSAQLQRIAKEQGLTIILIGHITKSGSIAGPKILEHLVDTVLYLESGQHNHYRTLRSIKNRFGSTNEVGIFEMRDTGLMAVDNPSGFFLAEKRDHISGSAISVSMEGTRPIMIEIQALVTKSFYGNPQRTANGVDYRKLAMLIAILEKRGGYPMGTHDVFVNIVGGLKIDETAINLAVVAAMASSIKDQAIPSNSVFIGEIGLGGEVRSIPFIEARVKEALKFGYNQIYIPKNNEKLINNNNKKVVGVDSIGHLFGMIF